MKYKVKSKSISNIGDRVIDIDEKSKILFAELTGVFREGERYGRFGEVFYLEPVKDE